MKKYQLSLNTDLVLRAIVYFKNLCQPVVTKLHVFN